MVSHLAPLPFEVVVVDGGSTDSTFDEARSYTGVTVLRYEGLNQACRATQMNYGVAQTSGDVLWFVHADVVPPLNALERIGEAVETGASLGGFAFDFESSSLLLQLNALMTRLNWSFTRGGDQTLFVTRELWNALSGYRPEFVIMEEYDLIDRAEALGFAYRRMPGVVRVSARKYVHNSYVRVQLANLKAFTMYRKGASPDAIKRMYHRILRHPKDE